MVGDGFRVGLRAWRRSRDEVGVFRKVGFEELGLQGWFGDLDEEGSIGF